jgi:hypothetical protein
MRGVVDRLTLYIPPTLVRSAGEDVMRRQSEGTLRTAQGLYYHETVNQLELPKSLRTKVECVAFLNPRTIVFDVNKDEGFVWTRDPQAVVCDWCRVTEDVWVRRRQRP